MGLEAHGDGGRRKESLVLTPFCFEFAAVVSSEVAFSKIEVDLPRDGGLNPNGFSFGVCSVLMTELSLLRSG